MVAYPEVQYFAHPSQIQRQTLQMGGRYVVRTTSSRDNPPMRYRLLLALLWIGLAAGCPAREQPAPVASDSGTKASVDQTSASDAAAAKASGKPKPVRKGDFGLPLEYTIPVPDVPERLLRPSRPLEGPGKPAAPAKGSASRPSPAKVSPPAK